MSKDNTPKQPEKKIKTSTLVSKSGAMQITEHDNTKLQDVMEASKFNGYLSLLGRKLIKKSLKSDIPLKLKAINHTVLEKEDGGYLQQQGKPKKGDEDEDSGMEKEDKKNAEDENEDVEKEDGREEQDVHATIVNDTTNASKDYDIKDPFIKSNSNKAMDICISCGLIPCKLEVYGDHLKKRERTLKGKNYATIVLFDSTAVKFYLVKIW